MATCAMLVAAQSRFSVDRFTVGGLTVVLAWMTSVLVPDVLAADVGAYAPCEQAPPGMVCVPGGPAIVGNDDGPPHERPRRSIALSTFYIDAHEAKNAEYRRCVAAKVCPPLSIWPSNQNIMRPFVGDNQPAVTVDYARAVKYCTFVGKRLPTEWEWEKAARGPDGDLYPWGNAPPTCDRAQFRECAPKGCKPYPGKKHIWDCVEHATKDVGSYPAGHYGIFDMAGNGYEWTSSWAGETPKKPCTKCTGLDPTGICSATDPCSRGGGKKVLRGGSWYWPMDQVRASHRRFEVLDTKTHRLSVRCAADTPKLAGFPTLQGTEVRKTPPALPTPDAAQIAAAQNIKQDDLNKQKCAAKGRSFLDCRDPSSYIKTNEPRQHVWKPYIKNLGGGYAGVGIDQNYSLMAEQRAEWGWLFDYDPTVVRLHHVIRAVVIDSKDRDTFIAAFADGEKPRVTALLGKFYAADPDVHAIREVYRVTQHSLYGYYQKQRRGEKEDPTYGWLATDEAYEYIRLMFQQQRIVILKGDMLGKNTMQGIAVAARAVNVPVRVYYPSNAPEFWPHSQQYKNNVRALPFDGSSVVLQTLSGLRAGYGETQKGHWHYNVQRGTLQQQLMARPEVVSVRQLVTVRNKTNDSDLTVSGLERAAP